MKQDRRRKSDPHSLLAWAASVIAEEQAQGSFCVISIHVEAGTITRISKEQSFKPPVSGERVNG